MSAPSRSRGASCRVPRHTIHGKVRDKLIAAMAAKLPKKEQGVVLLEVRVASYLLIQMSPCSFPSTVALPSLPMRVMNPL